jgi:aspartyl protease family protein
MMALAMFLGDLPDARSEPEVRVLALMDGKAILDVSGVRRVLAEGEVSPEGVQLVEATTEHAVVEVDGHRRTLALELIHAPIIDRERPAAESVVLWAGPDGFFHVDGSINGYPVRFLVDTGASTIALSGELARRVGLRFEDGTPGFAHTAGGIASMVHVTLSSVSIGPLTIRDVDAGVIPGGFPSEPLLGMSFLGQLDMVREGQRLELRKR